MDEIIAKDNQRKK